MDERARRFKARLERDVLRHPVIVANPYTPWFRQGEFDDAHARVFLIQFSVFSNQFLVAQLLKMLNADTVEEMRESKEILANEIGVGFTESRVRPPARAGSDVEHDSSEVELGDPEGTIEGGTFRFRAAHFELLARMARQLGLGFADLGKRRLGTPATLDFCDELIRLYGDEDYTVAAAASWAVENWAAAGFWDDLVEGWRRYAERRGLERFDIGFFTWHAKLERNHARHTDDELEHFLKQRSVDEEVFVEHARQMLDGVLVFWRGLDRLRRFSSKEGHHVA